MASELKSVTKQEWESALEKQDKVDIPTVAKEIMVRYPEFVARERDRLILDAIKRELTQLARAVVQGVQLELFGFPSVIAVPEAGDGYLYMKTLKAKWPDLVSGAQIRQENVQRAQQKLDTYQDALDYVRPLMEGTELTFAEATRKLS